MTPATHRGGCGFCRWWQPNESADPVEARRPARCMSPQVLPRVVAWDVCRDDPALCGESARWWEAAGVAP